MILLIYNNMIYNDGRDNSKNIGLVAIYQRITSYLCLSMQKKFISNLIFLLIVNLLVKPFYILGIDVGVQNQVGTEVYGEYFALLGFAFIFNMILDMGINNYNTREVAQDETFIKSKFSKLFSLRLILFVIYLIVIAILGIVIGFSAHEQKLLILLGIVQGLAMTVLFLRSNLTGLHLFKQDSIISVLDRIILIVVLSVLLWGGVVDGFQIEWFIYAQMGAYLITAIIAFILVVKHTNKFSLTFNKSFSVITLKKSIPFALLAFLMWIFYRMDSVMLKQMLEDGNTQAGIYAKGYRFFEAANMIAYLFAVLLMPIFSKMLKEKENISELVILSFKIIFSGALVVAVLCFVFSEELLTLRYTEYLTESAPVFGLLMISFLFACIAYIFGTLLTANGNMKTLNTIALFSVIINVVLNLILIPKYYAYGAALASVITFGFSSLMQVIFSFRKISLQISAKNWASVIIYSIGVVTFSWFCTIFFDIWLYNALAFVLLSVIWAFITKMISFNQIKTILKSD